MVKKLYSALAGGVDPYENLALEEYLLERVPEDAVILYLWQNAHTVVIGRNQNALRECRLPLLEQEGGHLARRLSGGGAVYHDLGNLNFTLLCREEDYDLQKQLSVIQRAVSYSGIQAEFSGRNDLLAQGRKFSGNAFYHSKGRAYHHGTLLVATDIDRLQRYLSPPKAKLQSKGVASVRSRVINLCELAPGLTCQQLQKNMLRAFGEIYGGEPAPFPVAEPSALEGLKSRYQSQLWLYGKELPFSCAMEGRISLGSICLQFSVEGGVIRELYVYTDAMDAQLPEKLRAALIGCPFRAEALRQAVCPLSAELGDFIASQL